ncbi:PQQ-binding-like beta-propeller repeat protein [Yoonia sp. BS5-3]|uniref:PQQ-binding-like beta-propeller repeat protein n=1 Tax=Yoonia phaeophyticola TaxID=3137369 RepID=A0ABZ2V1C9_9RHOB
MTAKTIIGVTFALGLLAACGEEDVILPGERFDLRPNAAEVNQTRNVAIAAAQVNANWTHRNGGADHQIDHPALPATLSPAFVADIGEGDSKRARITSEPVIAGGIIYTVDARATVTATSLNGDRIWSRDLTPTRDNANDASGGGVSVGGGQVYVTTGFGEITAMDAATGNIRWVQDLDAPVTTGPTLNGDLVYVVSRDSTAWALEPSNGRIRWQRSGTPSSANFGGGASPAVSGEYAIFPFPSGEIAATYPRGGLPRWSAVVSGDRLGRAASLINDIAGDPVIFDGRVYIANFGGRTVALDLDDGSRIWTAGEGAVSPVWPTTDSLFLINDVNELVRLDAATGAAVWRISLPNFDEGRTARQRSVFAHYGPILAGGRLIVASSDGLIRQFDPTSGGLIGTIDLPGGAASAPVVAGETLYVLNKDGQLHAFR